MNVRLDALMIEILYWPNNWINKESILNKVVFENNYMEGSGSATIK